jgi:hypothetical protein
MMAMDDQESQYIAHKSLREYVENVIDEQLHDLDPAHVRARRRAVLARMQPLRICGGWDESPWPRLEKYCGRFFCITMSEEEAFGTCPECRQRQARRRRAA